MSTQGDGMAEVTEADREKAQLLCAAAADSIVFGRWERGSVHEAVDAIAAALAEEREKARDEVYRELTELAGREWHVAPEETE